jgi:L-alanine-DL-glutamate epimerase-like enolase superfamily enzyme
VTRITEVALFRLDLPLADPFQHASSGRIDTLEEVVCRVRTDAGIDGWGEVRGNCAYVTGDTADRVVAAASSLAPLLLDLPVDRLIDLHDRLGHAIVGNSAAKALLDIAVHDAAARAAGVSVASLLGGQVRDRLPTDASVPFMPPGEAAASARQAVREGFRVIKVRVGLSLREDEDRLTAVREAIDREPAGPAVVMAADANGAWEPKTAVRRLRRWEDLHLAWIEQPVAAEDIDGLRFVREHVAVPVMADESAQGPREVLHLIERRAVDLLHFKLIKAGGLAPLRAMMAIAEAAGTPYMVGQMDEGMLATAAAIHAGAASRARYFEVHGYARVRTQPFSGVELSEGAVLVPPGPGLGIKVDEQALRPVHRVHRP